ncbi:MAG: uncharacterized protein A8A55_2680, partial [Amphiamblys sp. WSBS2006]
GDSRVATLAECPQQAEVPTFSGERWEDVEHWLEQIQLGRTAADAFTIAKLKLTGQALIALKTAEEQAKNWKQLREWASMEFKQPESKKAAEFFSFLYQRKSHCSLADFIATAIDLGLAANLAQYEMTLAIKGKLPSKMQQEATAVVDLKSLCAFTKDLTSKGKLHWGEPKQAVLPSKERKKPTCNFCKKVGHVESNCRNKKKDAYSKKDALLCISDAIKVDGTVNGTRAKMLVDTGARDLYISENLADKINATPGEQHNVTVADGRQVLAHRAQHKVEVKFTNTAQRTRPTIVPGLAEEVILGRKPLAKAKVIIDAQRGELTTARPLRVRNEKVSKFSGGADIEDISNIHTATEALPKTLEDSKPILEKIRSKDEFDIGRTSVMECRVDTGKNQPVSKFPYPLTRDKEEYLEKILDELLQRKIIERIKFSRWSSPAILVKNKDKYRLCVDYRALNAITETERHPMPTLQQVFTSLAGARYFSVLDLTKGFWQLPLTPSDADKTTFVTKFGSFKWNVMPFGLKNAPALFQRMIDGVLDPVKGICAMAYIDDIIVYSKTREEHLLHLKTVGNLLHDAGLKISPTKCKFFCKEVLYLGHTISADGVTPPEKKIGEIVRITAPKSTRAVRSFLGMINYYRDYIPGIAQIAGPLYELLQKHTRFKWEPKHDDAFVKLKQALEKNCTLLIPNFEKPFVVYTDASIDGLGGMLAQLDDSGQERIVRTVSRTLAPAERNYGITELECLSVIWTLDKFRYYLVGREFRVITDHKALQWLDQHKDSNSKLMRWALQLQEFGDFEIQYRAGEDHGNADGLSRLPEEICTLDDEETSKALEAHAKLGHANPEITHKYLTRDPGWKGSLKDVQRLIKECQLCQNFGTKYDKFTKKRSVAFRPLEKIAIDIMEISSETDGGNKYIVAAIDYYSKWLFAKAIPDKKGSTIVDFVEKEVIMKKGIPDTIVSDNGKEFTNVQMEALCRKYGIRHSLTTAYYPQANGLIERTNRTILKKLSCGIRETKQDWDNTIPQMLMAYNSSPIKALGYSPFEILHGWTPKIIPRMTKIKGLDIHEIRRDITEKYLAQEEKQASEGDRTDDLEPGTKILLDINRVNPSGKKKLLKKWIGPYIIDARNSSGQYTIRDRSGYSLKANRRQIRPYSGNEPTVAFEEGGDVNPPLSLRLRTSS